MVANMSEENPYAAPEADVTVDEPMNLATRGARLGGAIIDMLIAIVIIWPMMYFLGYFDRAMEGATTIGDEIELTASGFVSFLVIHGYLLATRGQTVGKLVAGTRIVSVADNKILPFHKVILLRYLPLWVVAYIPVIGPIVGLINPLFIFRDDRRCLHDHIAGTRVIKA
jgi:uncharacterized RDD family membrane protein YckC